MLPVNRIGPFNSAISFYFNDLYFLKIVKPTYWCQGLCRCQTVSMGVIRCHFSTISVFARFSITYQWTSNELSMIFRSLSEYFPQLIICFQDCWWILDPFFISWNEGWNKNIPRTYKESIKKWKILGEISESNPAVVELFYELLRTHLCLLFIYISYIVKKYIKLFLSWISVFTGKYHRNIFVLKVFLNKNKIWYKIF